MSGSIATFLQNIFTMITSTLGISLAGIAVALCGALMIFGAMERGMFGRVIGGIGLLYGAAWTVQQITGGGGL